MVYFNVAHTQNSGGVLMYNNVLSGLITPFKPIFDFIINLSIFAAIALFVFIIAFIVSFFVKCKINVFKVDVEKLRQCDVKFVVFDLFRWILVDFLTRKERANIFPDFGFTSYVAKQGGGKTISIVNYVKRMKLKYPDCIVVANFNCAYADFYMKDWKDILNIRNGTNGVIFAIDEIHSEYSAASWKDVPENLLSEISQQRKQRVKIVASAQYFCRIAKPLREQATTVVACNTSFFGRFTSCRVYDGERYSSALESPTAMSALKPISKHSFVQSDSLRNCYDTYEKINIMRKIKFIPRNERG